MTIYSDYQIDLMLMDGITDLVSGAAFTMAGTATTATLLGATAPTISATEYTSCKIATPFTAGQALTIMCVVNTAWAGDDGVYHYLAETRDASVNIVRIWKHSANRLDIMTYNAGAAKYKAINTDATNWAAGTHVIIATLTADNTQGIYLDGVAGTISSGTATREAGVGSLLWLGTNYLGAATEKFTGSILCAIWGRVLTSDEIYVLSRLSTWDKLLDPFGARRRTARIIGG